MTDHEAAVQIRRLRALSRKWILPLGLGSWWTKIHMVYSREKLVSKKDAPIYARTWADHRYLEAQITFSLPDCVRLNDDDLETVFVHELAHLPVCRMARMKPAPKDIDDKLEETVVQIARMIVWARKAGRGDPKPTRKRK